jgi:hypothetical protein
MKLDKVIQVEGEALSAVRGLRALILRTQPPSHEVTRQFIELKKRFPKDTPRYVRTYIDGAWRIVEDEFDRGIEFRYFNPEPGGEWVTTRRESPEFYGEKGIKPGELQTRFSHCGHFWIESGNPFFTTEVSK